jgi:hypothetical protein
MPLPVPPRTPTPPPESNYDHGNHQPVGLGPESQLSAADSAFNPHALSPMSASFPDRYGTLAPSDSGSQKATPSTIYSPMSAGFPPYTPVSATSEINETKAPSLSGSDVGQNAPNPFNFQPVSYMPAKPQNKQVVCICAKSENQLLNYSGCWSKARTQVQAQ